MRFGRDVTAVADREEVRGAALVDMLFLFRVEVQHARIAFLVSDLGRSQARPVIASGLDVSGAERRGAVVVPVDDDPNRVESLFIVRAYGRYENDQQIFGGGLHADLRAGPEQYGPDVERCSGPVGRHEAFVGADDLPHHVGEQLDGRHGHLQVVGRRAQPFRVLVDAEDADFPVRPPECLLPLERLLSVMEGGGRHVHRHGLVGCQLRLRPCSVAEIAPYVEIRPDIAERKVFPIQIRVRHMLRF